MFDTFAKLLSSIPTFLFPVFASYKALKTSDPAQLTPWLMYWVVLACALLFESWTGFILKWIPFYAWFRLGFLLYLILPQTQGARVLYESHVEPFLRENELAIDDFISSAHERVKAAGVTYIKQAIDFIKEHVLGLPPRETPPPPPPSNLSYTQSLIARFNLPAARSNFSVPSVANTANDFYSLLALAAGAATSSASGASSQPRDLSNSGTLIPPTVHGEERLSFIAAQRERLSILLSALDKEASTIQNKAQSDKLSSGADVPSMVVDGSSDSEETSSTPMEGLTTRKSEGDFEKIEAESAAEDAQGGKRQVKRTQSSGGSWRLWSWGGQAAEASPASGVAEKPPAQSAGKSSSIEI